MFNIVRGGTEEDIHPVYLRCFIFIVMFTVYKVTFFLLFKYVPTIKTKELFVESASRPLVGTLMSIGDVTGNIAMY